MSVYFIGDPHLGHRNIAAFRPFVKSCQDNTDQFLDQYSKTINKRSIIYFMGDVAFSLDTLNLLTTLPGKKILIKGNHDDFVSTKDQMRVFDEIHGIITYKRMWLSHCPIHPAEMRSRVANIHGHVHLATLDPVEWPKYINVSVDELVKRPSGSWFISLEEIRSLLKERGLV